MKDRRAPTHPGGILRRLYLRPLNVSTIDLAKAVGVSRKTISKLINERGAVTPEMALRLSIAFKDYSAALAQSATELRFVARPANGQGIEERSKIRRVRVSRTNGSGYRQSANSQIVGDSSEAAFAGGFLNRSFLVGRQSDVNLDIARLGSGRQGRSLSRFQHECSGGDSQRSCLGDALLHGVPGSQSVHLHALANVPIVLTPESETIFIHRAPGFG
jgi:addiction module HigA family antidote